MRRFTVVGESMAPNLHEGDAVYCRGYGGPIQRGDLVVFRHPKRRRLTLIKRVIGLPGESITIDFGAVLVNGEPDHDVWGVGFTFPEGDWQMDQGVAFVLSDNRNATRDDSRTIGPILLDTMRRVTWLVRVGDERSTH